MPKRRKPKAVPFGARITDHFCAKRPRQEDERKRSECEIAVEPKEEEVSDVDLFDDPVSDPLASESNSLSATGPSASSLLSACHEGQMATTSSLAQAKDASLLDPNVDQSDASLLDRNVDQSDASLLDRNVDQSDDSLLDRNVDQSDASLLDRNVDQSDASLLDRNVDQSDAALLDRNVDQSDASLLDPNVDQSDASLLDRSVDQSDASLLDRNVDQSDICSPQSSTKDNDGVLLSASPASSSDTFGNGDGPSLGRCEAPELALLRRFDLDWRFGPCSGITRLERWRRARQNGLKPPDRVRRLVEQHAGERRFTECVWHDYNL